VLFGDHRRIERVSEGAFRLRLPRAERDLLRRLPADLREVLRASPDDPSLRRLFPRAYDDEADEHEYHRLMQDELAAGRRRALQVLEKTVDHDRLSAEEAQAWLTALNDLRLVLGTRLDVKENALLGDLDPRDPRAAELGLYAYLSWLQEQLVEAIGAGLTG
jgi:cation diffusion facilitator CzcD-associated flavoprotein CzcO